MALLCNQHYLKINFLDCCVRGGQVYVSYFIYPSQAERQKHKDRQSVQTECFTKINQYILSFDEESSTMDQIITMNDFKNSVNMIQTQMLIRKGNDWFYGAPIKDSTFIKMKEFGFLKEWIDDPVTITAETMVNCGPYNGEPVDYKLFYTKLKSRFDDAIDLL